MNINYEVPKVIAEIGCVHLGDINRAFDLCKLAKICGADFIKLQKRNPEESVPDSLKDKPHPNPIFSYGKTYLEHRKNLELSVDDHRKIQEYCKSIGIQYSSSVWDITSANEIISLNPLFIKIPSACNEDNALIDYLIKEYDGDIHISTGMTNKNYVNTFLDTYKKYGDRFVIYHCTSIYPCPFEKLYLKEIHNMYKLFKPFGFRIGFSNHGYGIAGDISAYSLGAEYIERHFIDDRTIRHTDAAASLEPDGLRRLCRDLNNIYKSLSCDFEKMCLDEETQKEKLKIRYE